MYLPLVVLVSLFACESSHAGCGGLKGEAREKCHLATRQMIQNHHREMEKAKKTELIVQFKDGKKLKTNQFDLFFTVGECAFLKREGRFSVLYAETKKPFANIECKCCTILDSKPPSKTIFKHGKFEWFHNPRVTSTSEFWCGVRLPMGNTEYFKKKYVEGC